MFKIIIYDHLPIQSYLFNKPCSAHESQMGLFDQNFNSIFRRDHQKISYERRAYESVDD